MIKLKSLLMEGMTRQHFEFVAKLLKIKDHEQQVQFAIDFFKKENPRFDENKFRKAIGVQPKRRSFIKKQGSSSAKGLDPGREGPDMGPRGQRG